MLPDTLRNILRPVVVSEQDCYSIVKSSLISYGFENSLRYYTDLLPIPGTFLGQNEKHFEFFFYLTCSHLGGNLGD